jgi:hypothetical protein
MSDTTPPAPDTEQPQPEASSSEPATNKPAAVSKPQRPKPPPRRPAKGANASSAGSASMPAAANLKKWAPYIAAGVTVAVVALLVRTPRFAAPGALAGGLIVLGLLAWVAMSYRESLPTDDKLRALIVPATLGVVLATAVPLVYTVYPPAPKGTVELRQTGDAQTVDLQGGVDLWATVTGQLSPTATGNGDYTVGLTLGSQSSRLAGRLRVQDQGLTERQNLSVRGPGTLRVELRGISSSLAPPLRVTVHSRPIPALWLSGLFFALLVLVIAIDVALYHRGIEPSYAAAMSLPLVAVMYLQLRPVGGAGIPLDLLAGGLVGAIAGGLGGEGLARIGRMIAPK